MIPQLKSERIYSLDYLRGGAALSIMFYHYSFWIHNQTNIYSILNFIGLYGVSIFYLLSGLTLFNVYVNGFDKKTDLSIYFIKRIFRIFPLLWLVTTLTVFILKRPFDIIEYLLNISGLFGIVAWDKYIAVGAWSIGNELCFYLLFPIMLYLIRKNTYCFYIAYFIQFIIYLIIAFVVLKDTAPLTEQWSNYINPLNQTFLFTTGIFIGKHIRREQFINIPAALFICVVAIGLCFGLMNYTSIDMVTGFMRMTLTMLSIMIVIYFYQMPAITNTYIHSFFKTTGEISYAIYLLHPLVYFSLTGIFKKLQLNLSHSWVHFLMAIAITYAASYLTFFTFEKYFIKKGNHLSNSLLK
jgi:exopolysaccharide production protein ExoZ